MRRMCYMYRAMFKGLDTRLQRLQHAAVGLHRRPCADRRMSAMHSSVFEHVAPILLPFLVSSRAQGDSGQPHI